MKKFILPENYPSRTILNHSFQDGVLFASDEDAKKMEKVLCRYYGVKMEDVPEDGSTSVEGADDGSLTVSNTKTGQPAPTPSAQPSPKAGASSSEEEE